MKTSLILIIGFVVTFSAGLVVGLWMDRPAIAIVADAGKNSPERSWLARQLELDAEQARQVKEVWSKAMGESDREDRRRTLRKEREEAIEALLGEEKRAQYENVQKQFADEAAQLRREREAAFEQAVAKTKKLLNAEQLAKYEQLLAKREADRQRDGGNRRGFNRRNGERGTTRPASE